MKRNRILSLMMAAAVLMGAASCNKDTEGGVAVDPT